MKLIIAASALALALGQTTPAPPAPAPPTWATTISGYDYCGPGRRCHGPADSGPDTSQAALGPQDINQYDPTTGKLVNTDPSQWLCANVAEDDSGDPKAQKNANGVCSDQSPIQANLLCPALCSANKNYKVPNTFGAACQMVGGAGAVCDNTQKADGTDGKDWPKGMPNGAPYSQHGENFNCNAGTDTTYCTDQVTACESYHGVTSDTVNVNSFGNEVSFGFEEGGAGYGISRCPGSVLKSLCKSKNATKAATCAATATDTKVCVNRANCLEWVEEGTQIPSDALWVEDYVTKVYADGYAFSGYDGHDDATTTDGKYCDKTYVDADGKNVCDTADENDESRFAKNQLGYFHGIVPNYKTTVQLTTGTMVLVRIWNQAWYEAQKSNAAIFPPAYQKNFQSFDQFETVCGEHGDELRGKGATTRSEMATRGWCWRRGHISDVISVTPASYVVTLEAELGNAVIKSVDPYDVRPVCFQGPEFKQNANCSTAYGSCTNMAGTSAPGVFTYQLGQTVAIDNTDGTFVTKKINAIDQSTNTITDTENIDHDLTINTYDGKGPAVLQCAQVTVTNGTTAITAHPACPNEYQCEGDKQEGQCVAPGWATGDAKRGHFTYHYGLEFQKMEQTGTYQRGIAKTFTLTTDNTTNATTVTATVQQLSITKASTPASGICYSTDSKGDQWTVSTDTTPAPGMLPVCYQPVNVADV